MNTQDWIFVAALAFASVIRTLSSPFHSIWRSALLLVTSMFVAWVFTAPVVDWWHLNPDVYKVPVGVLIAFTADGLVRIILNAAADPAGALALWEKFRGGGK